MFKFINAILLTCLLFVVSAPAAEARLRAVTPLPVNSQQHFGVQARSDDVAYGIHPWDVRSPRARVHYDPLGARRYGVSKYYFYTHPDRSQTHALHPYYRERYYESPLNADAIRYSRSYRSDIRYTFEDAYVPQSHNLSTCYNYSYGRANYRVPPYGYRCVK